MDAAVCLPEALTTRTDTVRGRSAMQARGIVEDVVTSIRSGALRPGDRLPDERSLCRHYAAGRHTVRKAMEVLEGDGLIGRFVGRGSFVLDPPAAQPAARTATERGWTLLQLTEARLLLEPGVAMLAAERRTTADLARLGRCVARIEKADTWRNFKEAKYAFHRTVAQVAGNDFICDVFDQIIGSRRKAWDGYHLRPQDLADVQTTCVEECQAILHCLAEGQADAAAEAVRRSINRLLLSLRGS